MIVFDLAISTDRALVYACKSTNQNREKKNSRILLCYACCLFIWSAEALFPGSCCLSSAGFQLCIFGGQALPAALSTRPHERACYANKTPKYLTLPYESVFMMNKHTPAKKKKNLSQRFHFALLTAQVCSSWKHEKLPLPSPPPSLCPTPLCIHGPTDSWRSETC